MMEESDTSELLALQLELEGVDDRIKSIGQQINRLLSQQEQLSEKKTKLHKKIKNLEQHGSGSKGVEEWSSNTFPWANKLKEVMKEHFHINTFRSLQKEAMNVTLSNEDCILIMPTGGGKSLTFQLPALLSKGFTLVISPLISLMEDQVIALRKLNITASMLSATSSKAENNEILSSMIIPASEMKILYVTPERLAKSKRFMNKLEKAYSIGNVSRIVIDEIHCASNWGHDFRPDYQILGILKRQFPKLPILGLTATASEKVLSDVKDILNVDRCIVFRASFNRPNLLYEVCKTSLDQKSLITEIAKRIKLNFKDMSGIVYCFSRKDSEEVASGLVDAGIMAHCYHSDMAAEVKTQVHEGWINGNIQVVVATIAFGMGIDKADVRFVFHYSISKSMENYYQESGRAGRDDKQSSCILYFRFQDIFRQCGMVFTEKTGLENLRNMVRYALDRHKCRRTLIGKHFAEQWKAEDCKNMCDNCRRGFDNITERSVIREASQLVDILQTASMREERLTPVKLIDLWTGKGRVKDRPKDICSLPREDCEDIVSKLLVEQVLSEDFHFTPYSTITYVVPGSRWPLLKHGKIDIKIPVLSTKTKKKAIGSCNGANKDGKKAEIVDVDLSESFGTALASKGKVSNLCPEEKKSKTTEEKKRKNRRSSSNGKAKSDQPSGRLDGALGESVCDNAVKAKTKKDSVFDVFTIDSDSESDSGLAASNDSASDEKKRKYCFSDSD